MWKLRHIIHLLLTFMILGGSFSDYPPHDLSYRTHAISLYPWEAHNSPFCEGRSNGIYPHFDLDFGDPRCTFVMCTNGRTVVNSCPRGTRTGFFVIPASLTKAWKLNRKYGKGPNIREMLSFYRNYQSNHGICDYYDHYGVCGTVYPA